MEKTVKVLFVTQKEAPKVIDLKDDLKSLQTIVGGQIEIVHPFADSNIGILCNEEGKFNGSYPNRILWYKDMHPDLYNPDNSEIFDVIYGDFCIFQEDDECEFVDIETDKIEKYTKLFESRDYVKEHYVYSVEALLLLSEDKDA